MNTRSVTAVLIGTLLVALTSTPANAHEEGEHEGGVYESLGHIPIGRIFLTPDERARLDSLRGKAPVTTSRPSSSGKSSPRRWNTDAAGFIVSDSGKTRVWKNGDFVTSDSARGVRFPGQVKVDSKRTDADDVDRQETDAAPVGAGDEQD